MCVKVNRTVAVVSDMFLGTLSSLQAERGQVPTKNYKHLKNELQLIISLLVILCTSKIMLHQGFFRNI